MSAATALWTITRAARRTTSGYTIHLYSGSSAGVRGTTSCTVTTNGLSTHRRLPRRRAGRVGEMEMRFPAARRSLRTAVRDALEREGVSEA